MKSKTVGITYWILIIFFAALMLADGIAGVMREIHGQEGLKHLGYPVYLMTIVGIAKILGVIAILQTKYTTIKEWAFAGFTFNFIGASMSHYFAGDDIGMVLMPVVGLAILFLVYFFWKRFEQVNILKTA